MPRDRNTEDARDLFDRGHAALDAGDAHEAVECFTRAIRLRPDVAAAYRGRAAAFLKQGDRARALSDLDHAIRLKPDDLQVYADRAAELFAQKSFDLAVADCDRVLTGDPGRADVAALRGMCHAARGDTESALRDYAAAIAGDPEEAPRVLLWRANLHLDCENFAAALADCDAAVRLDPENADAHHLRGTTLHSMNDLPAATEAFADALALAPDHVFARLGRAVCHFQQSNMLAVLGDCDEVIQRAPQLLRAYDLRGSARLQLGDADGALADFDEAVRLAPSATGPYNQRARVHYACGRYSAAIRDHMEALKRDPRSAGTFNQLAWVWATCPDPDVRNGARAKECATRACELTEWGEAEFLDTLAAAHAECGEYDDAVRWQEKALELVDGIRATDYRTRLDLYRNRKPARVVGSVQ